MKLFQCADAFDILISGVNEHYSGFNKIDTLFSRALKVTKSSSFKNSMELNFLLTGWDFAKSGKERKV